MIGQSMISARDVVVGQEPAVHFLEAGLAQDRLSHCYLFAGPVGTGRKTLALVLAKAILCERGLGKRLEFCGECRMCRKIDRGLLPEVRLVEPKGVDEAGEDAITIDQARAVRSELAIRPVECSRRIYILEGADRMRAEASNALLKTLEEPPAYALLILVAQNPSQVLPTILSRCQVVRFGLVGAEEISELLVTRFAQLPSARREEVVQAAGGNPGLALGLAGNPTLWSLRCEVVDTLTQLSRGAETLVLRLPERWLSLASRWWEETHGQEAKGDEARDRAARRGLLPVLDLLSAHFREAVMDAGDGLPREVAQEMMQAILAVRALASTNLNLLLLLQVLALQLQAQAQRRELHLLSPWRRW